MWDNNEHWSLSNTLERFVKKIPSEISLWVPRGQQRCAVSALWGQPRCRLLLLLLLLASHSFTFSFLSLSSLLPIPIFHGVVKRRKLNPCARYSRLHNTLLIFNSLNYFFFSQSLISDFVCFVRWLRGRSGSRLFARGRIPLGQRGLLRFSQGHRRLVPFSFSACVCVCV